MKTIALKIIVLTFATHQKSLYCKHYEQKRIVTAEFHSVIGETLCCDYVISFTGLLERELGLKTSHKTSKSWKQNERKDDVREGEYATKNWDQYPYLGNCLPTPPLTVVGLGEG